MYGNKHIGWNFIRNIKYGIAIVYFKMQAFVLYAFLKVRQSIILLKNIITISFISSRRAFFSNNVVNTRIIVSQIYLQTYMLRKFYRNDLLY